MKTELDRLCEKLRIKCESVYGGVEVPEGFPPGSHPYRVTLRYQRRRLTVPFFCGPASEREPTAADVLSCLCSDTRAGEQSFEEFCGDFGYDRDSRNAERIYLACEKLAPRVRRLLGDAFDDVAGAEH